LAWGGATVDSKLAKPYLPTVHSLTDQIDSDYLPIYGKGSKRKLWSPNNTLFSFWIGINDIVDTYATKNSSLVPTIFNEYAALIEKVYDSGARNFLLMDVPAIQNSPLLQAADDVKDQTAAIKDWALRLMDLATDLKMKHADVTVEVFSTYAVFQNILKASNAYSQTAQLKQLSGYCAAYMK
jgi:hypothetical protein